MHMQYLTLAGRQVGASSSEAEQKYRFRYRKELKFKGEGKANRPYFSLINVNFYYPFVYSSYFCVLDDTFRKPLVFIFLCVSPFLSCIADVLHSNLILYFSFSNHQFTPAVFLLPFHFYCFPLLLPLHLPNTCFYSSPQHKHISS